MSAMISIQNKRTDGMDLSVLSYAPPALGSLSVRYLIIASGFPYVKVEHYSKSYGSPIIYNRGQSHFFT